MCNLSMGVYNDGIKKGVVQNAIEVVNKLLAKSFTLEEALEIAGIDKATYEKYYRIALI